jgi:iron-sulfur cluster assembly protein
MLAFNPVHISSTAAKEIKNILANKNIPKDYGLRIGVKGGGCSGMSYMLGFDQKKEGDMEFQTEDIRVIIEKKHIMYLTDMTIDFQESAETRGFIFINPNDNQNPTEGEKQS